MYLNGCIPCPSVMPLELALNYWTSYSAYHEAAYAALMNSKSDSVRHDLRHSFHYPVTARSEKDTENLQKNDNNPRRHCEEANHPRSSTPSDCSPDARLSPLGRLKRLSPESADSHTGYNGVLDFSKKSNPQQTTSSELKFGISRILSDKVGSKESESGKPKDRTERGNHYVPTSCPCSSSSCPYAACRRVPGLTSSLSAVHALRPPQYPVTSGTDALPGPYSVLNTDSSCPSHPKRKRSWSRAVFSQLQRKGLEKRFEVQKYVTKPDRRQLAAMLGLTDAQVKVWFQNRRMKWRHAEKSAQQSSQQKDRSGNPEQDSEKTDLHGDDLISKSDASSPCPDILSSDEEGSGPEQMDSVDVDMDGSSVPPSRTADSEPETGSSLP